MKLRARRHFFDQRFDVRAQELEAAVAGLADEMKVPRVTVGMLEAEAAFAEVDLARDARLDHPLQRAVDGGAADALIFAADQVDQVVGGEVAFLAQEDVDDEIALAGTLAAGRTQTVDERSWELIPSAQDSRALRGTNWTTSLRTSRHDRASLEPRAVSGTSRR